MKNIKESKKGMTLIEVIITLAISFIVISLIYSIFFAGSKSFTTIKDKGMDQQEIRIASVVLTREIKMASDIRNSDPPVESPEDYRKIEIVDGLDPGTSNLIINGQKHGPFKESVFIVSNKSLKITLGYEGSYNADNAISVYFEKWDQFNHTDEFTEEVEGEEKPKEFKTLFYIK